MGTFIQHVMYIFCTQIRSLQNQMILFYINCQGLCVNAGKQKDIIKRIHWGPGEKIQTPSSDLLKYQ